MEKLYSSKDIERLLGLRVGRIRYWDKIGFLTPGVKIGTRKYYTSHDLIGLRTAKGLLDAGLPFAKVRLSVIDVKKISPGRTKIASQLLIRGDGKTVAPRSGIIGVHPRQYLIGLSRGDLERGMEPSTIGVEPDCRPDGTARENRPRRRGSIKPSKP
jgi:hypothetical protein